MSQRLSFGENQLRNSRKSTGAQRQPQPHTNQFNLYILYIQLVFGNTQFCVIHRNKKIKRGIKASEPVLLVAACLVIQCTILDTVYVA